MMWKWSELKRLLKKADEVSSSACVMWPVVDSNLVDVEEPHVTVIYLGDVSGLNKDDILDAMREVKELDGEIMLSVKVTGLEWFGPEADIPVLTVDHTYLYSYRDKIEAALNKRGISNASQYKDYKPHMTISETLVAGSNWESSYFLGQPELWWGREHIKP